MTNPRMKLLPEKLTLDMRTAMYCAGPDFDKTYPAAVEHAPHAGQVSREQVEKAAKVCWEEGYIASLQSLGLEVEEE